MSHVASTGKAATTTTSHASPVATAATASTWARPASEIAVPASVPGVNAPASRSPTNGTPSAAREAPSNTPRTRSPGIGEAAPDGLQGEHDVVQGDRRGDDEHHPHRDGEVGEHLQHPAPRTLRVDEQAGAARGEGEAHVGVCARPPTGAHRRRGGVRPHPPTKEAPAVPEVRRVAILDDYQHVARQSAAWERVTDGLGAELTAFHEHLGGPDDVVAALEPFDTLVVMRERTAFPAEVLERLPNLRLLVTTGPANAAIDVAAAHRAGITVSGTGGVLDNAATVEMTWALILAAVRHVPEEDRRLREGGWQETVGADLKGRRLGVVGLGGIGKPVAAVGQAFGMDVAAWSRHLDPDDARAVGVTPVDKEELFATSDVVTIHMKLSRGSRGLVGREDLARMTDARDPGEHLARADRRRGRAAGGAARRDDRGRGARRLRHRAAPGGLAVALGPAHRPDPAPRVRHGEDVRRDVRRRRRGHRGVRGRVTGAAAREPS